MKNLYLYCPLIYYIMACIENPKCIIFHMLLQPLHCTPDTPSMDWYESYNMPYVPAVDFMTQRAQDIRNKDAKECVWFVEHPPLYTGGTSATDGGLLNPHLPVYKTGRGGQYTYHGTGQRTLYIMLDLEKRRLGIRDYVHLLEQWIINSLATLHIVGERRCGRVGIWVDMGNGYEDKICAIGVRVKRWVSFHGIALNIHPDLSHYNHIIPCGITDQKYGVTSFEKLGFPTDTVHIDTVLVDTFLKIFSTP